MGRSWRFALGKETRPIPQGRSAKPKIAHDKYDDDDDTDNSEDVHLPSPNGLRFGCSQLTVADRDATGIASETTQLLLGMAKLLRVAVDAAARARYSGWKCLARYIVR